VCRTKLNESSDRSFYNIPRFVKHVDDGFLAQVTELYRQRIPAGGWLDGPSAPSPSVLHAARKTEGARRAAIMQQDFPSSEQPSSGTSSGNGECRGVHKNHS
jgi:hypothetical protein